MVAFNSSTGYSITSPIFNRTDSKFNDFSLTVLDSSPKLLIIENVKIIQTKEIMKDLKDQSKEEKD